MAARSFLRSKWREVFAPIMSLSLSATGWSAAGTLLAAFTGSAVGAAAGATGVAVAVSALAGSDLAGSVFAGSVLAVSLFGASGAGVVATSNGLVSTLSG